MKSKTTLASYVDAPKSKGLEVYSILLLVYLVFICANQEAKNIMYLPVEALAICGAIIGWFSSVDSRKFVPFVAAFLCVIPILRDIGEAFILAYLFPSSLQTPEGLLAITWFGLDAILFVAEIVLLMKRWSSLNTARFTLHGPEKAIEELLPHINMMLSDCSLDPNAKEPCLFKLTKPEIWTLTHHVTGDYTNLVSARMTNLMYAHGYILDKHSYQTTEELFVYFKDINKLKA